MIYALDTNIVSYMLQDNEKINNQTDLITQNGHTLIIPAIVDYEIRRGLLAKNYLKKLRKLEQLQQIIEIGEFNLDVWRKAAQIYAALSKQGKVIGGKFDGDVFIAAYCIVNGYTLITNNKDHFERIDGLSFKNWKT
jgi:predicted nucleic acid-binding protein